jgi:glutathione S-transferase
VNRALDVATSIAASLVRLGSGLAVGVTGPRPDRPLELYEFESCPYCRKVREALSLLDLDAQILPCPKRGPRLRPELIQRGGKAQFPYLIDPNTGSEMYESDAIVRYLFETYGEGRVPLALAAGKLTDLSAGLASALRAGQGTFYRRARAPERALELYSFEASPFCRIVREELSSLELPYLLHNVAKGSPKREAFVSHESADIVSYLRDTYALRGG